MPETITLRREAPARGVVMRKAFAAAPPSDDPLEYVMSDATLDSYGDIIEPAGWQLASFRHNPIALFGHMASFFIGNWSKVRVEAGRLIGQLSLMDAVTDRLREIQAAVDAGVLRAVSVGFDPQEWEPIVDGKGKPTGGIRFLKQRLVECSLVAVPANPNALQLARSLNLSRETMSLVFGEQAATSRWEVAKPGEQAAKPTRYRDLTTMPEVVLHTSQRLLNAKASLSVAEGRRDDLLAATTLDHDAIDAANDEIETLERDIAVLERSEKRLATRAAGNAGVTAPAINRRPLGFPQTEVKNFDLLVRRAVIFGVTRFGDMSVEKALDERYPGHEATALVCKADAPLATTTGSHFVDDLQRVSYQGFLDALDPMSVWPALRAASGLPMNFDSSGTVYVPGVTAGGANGSFFAEGAPIRVGRITTTSGNMDSRKMGVIIPFSREAAKRSTPNLEALFRSRMMADTATVIDTTLLDATAGDSVRPAGLLNGVSAVASGFGGGDHEAVKQDFIALLTPFINAKAAGGVTVLMNPVQGLSISLMDGPTNNPNWFANIRDRVNIIESENVTAGRLIAIRTQDLATAMGGPEFAVSTQATIHLDDTTPLPIYDGSAADPVRSFYQTDSMGIRMILDISWKMMRSGMVQWVDSVSY